MNKLKDDKNELYIKVRNCFIESLKDKKEMSMKSLQNNVSDQLNGNIQGRVNNYIKAVTLDLQSRNIIERVEVKGDECYRLLDTAL
jgi:hypothetical protein